MQLFGCRAGSYGADPDIDTMSSAQRQMSAPTRCRLRSNGAVAVRIVKIRTRLGALVSGEHHRDEYLSHGADGTAPDLEHGFRFSALDDIEVR